MPRGGQSLMDRCRGFYAAGGPQGDDGMQRLIRARGLVVSGCLVLAASLGAYSAIAYAWQQAESSESDEQEEGEPQLPDDPKLVELYRDFIVRAGKLAKDFEREQDVDNARICYEQILKLVPGYPDAEEALARIRQKEANAQRRSIDVLAVKGWQDTGVDFLAGKPFTIRAEGSWLFRMSHELTADGMEIPEELRGFNLGSLVGMIDAEKEDDRKPFFIGSAGEFKAPATGRLMLRMYDSDPSDNSGRLNVEIRGTFMRN